MPSPKIFGPWGIQGLRRRDPCIKLLPPTYQRCVASLAPLPLFPPLPLLLIAVSVFALSKIFCPRGSQGLRRHNPCSKFSFLSLPSHLAVSVNCRLAMVACQRSSFAHIMEDITPPADLFAASEKRWASGVVEDEYFAAGRSLCAVVDLDVGDLAETSRSTFNILRSLSGRHS